MTEVQVQESQQSECVIEQVEEDVVVEQCEVHEQVECQTYTAEVSSETVMTMTTTTTTTSEEVVTFEELAADATGEPVNEDLIAEETKSQEDEVSIVSSAFAEQLLNVQTQLMALSHLPKTIQSTLDEITKQLQSLIPPSKLKQPSIEPEAQPEEPTNEGKFRKRSVKDENKTFLSSLTHPTESQVQIEATVEVEQSSQTTVEITTETRTTIETVMEEQKQVEEPAIVHLTKENIEDYEETQAAFRELWEKKREKVSFRTTKVDFPPRRPTRKRLSASDAPNAPLNRLLSLNVAFFLPPTASQQGPLPTLASHRYSSI